MLAGVSNGLFLDPDYSEEDPTDVQVKHPFDSRTPAGPSSWAYIPIPYFIPSQLYSSWFANPSQYFPAGPGGLVGLQTFNSPAHALHGDVSPTYSNAPVDKLENSAAKIDARGRLTRQASSTVNEAALAEKEVQRVEEKVTEATTEVEAEADSTSKTATDSEIVIESTTRLSNEILSTGSIGNGADINSSTKAPASDSFEVSEWEYLNNNNNGTVHNPEGLKLNQTSSYFRRTPTSFDPDTVSFTTWYPLGAAAVVHKAPIVASPFRPSQEQNEGLNFQPVAGPSGDHPYQ